MIEIEQANHDCASLSQRAGFFTFRCPSGLLADMF